MDPTQKERRRRGIGGSDVAAVLGLSPFATPMDVWLEKTGQDPVLEGDQEGDRKQKRRGQVLEMAVAQWYKDDLGTPRVDVWAPSPADLPLVGAEPWMLGSPDRFVALDTDALTTSLAWMPISWGLEAKTARDPSAWGETGSDVVPVYYFLQCVWYMAITGAQRWDMAVYFPFQDEFRRYTILRQPDIEERVVGTVRSWWNTHVVGGEPPRIDGSTVAARWLTERYRTPGEPVREATAAELALAAELRLLRHQMEPLRAREEEVKNLLRASIGSARGITTPWGPIDWTPTKGAERIDVRALRAAHPDIAAQFTVTGKPGRSLTPRFKDDDP